MEIVLPQNKSLEESDNEVFGLIQEERQRQVQGLELIASEVLVQSSFCFRIS
jgi:glycine/serine hydroxymethyltransferase